MSFLKTFFIGILCLMASSLALALIIYTSFGYFSMIITIFTVDFPTLVYYLLCQMGVPIWLTIELLAFHITNDNLFYIFLILITIIAPLIAAIVTGRISYKRMHSLISIFIISLINMVVSMILMMNSVSYQIIISGATLGNGALFIVLFGSLLNGLLYGLLAFFTTKK